MTNLITNTFIDYSLCRPDILDRFWSKVDRSGECWTWTARKLPSGYGQFFVYNEGRKNRTMLAHRFIDIAFNGEIEDGVVVMHVCDNPSCVRPSHLKRGTSHENTADMHEKGRHPRTGLKGTRHHKAKLSDDQARTIKASVEGQKVLADRYRVTEQTIWWIRSGKGWKHLDESEVA